MLERGDLIVHFSARADDGRMVDYRDIWQQRNLVLVHLSGDDPGASAYAAALHDESGAIAALDAELLITRDDVPRVPAPGLVIADRWGEVFFATVAPRAVDLPPADEILDWLQHVQHQCPECQGEVR